MKKKLILALVVLSILLFSAQAYALEFNFWADEATYTNSYWPGSNYSDETKLRVRDAYTATGKEYLSRAFMNFDTAAMQAAIGGNEILSVSLHLYQVNLWDSTTDGGAIDLYRVVDDWSEGNVTWDQSPGIAGERITYRTFADNETSGWKAWTATSTGALVNLVNGWMDGSIDSYGLALLNDLSDPNNEVNVQFRNWAEAGWATGAGVNYKPYLKITATPEPFSAVLFGIGGCLFAAAAIKRKKLI